MNNARRRIISEKKKLEEMGGEKPEEYSWPFPPEGPEDYMAHGRKLWYQGIRSYQQYLADENYQYLCGIVDNLSKETTKRSSVHNVISYVEGLRYALIHKDFLILRRHEEPERYLERFRECRLQIGEMLLKEEKESVAEKENEQLDLFQMGMSRTDGQYR